MICFDVIIEGYMCILESAQDKKAVKKALSRDKSENFTSANKKNSNKSRDDLIVKKYFDTVRDLNSYESQKQFKYVSGLYEDLLEFRRYRKGYKDEMRLVKIANIAIQTVSKGLVDNLRRDENLLKYVILAHDVRHRYKEEKSEIVTRQMLDSFALIDDFCDKFYEHVVKKYHINDEKRKKNLQNLFYNVQYYTKKYRSSFPSDRCFVFHEQLFKLFDFHQDINGYSTGLSGQTIEPVGYHRQIIKERTILIKKIDFGTPEKRTLNYRLAVLHECVHFLSKDDRDKYKLAKEPLVTLFTLVVLRAIKEGKVSHSFRRDNYKVIADRIDGFYFKGAYLFWYILGRSSNTPIYLVCLSFLLGRNGAEYLVNTFTKGNANTVAEWLNSIKNGKGIYHEIRRGAKLRHSFTDKFESDVEKNMPRLSKTESYSEIRKFLTKSQYFEP